MTQERDNDEIRQYKERLSIALRAAKICIFEVDLARQLYTFFENAEVIFGVPGEKILRDVRPYSPLEPEEYRLRVSEYFSHPDDLEVIERAFARVLSGESVTYEARMRAGGSGFVWCKIDATPILEDGRPSRMVGVVTDITEIKARTDRLKQAADRDGFTGLYNKRYVTAAIQDILCRDKHLQHALVLLDIDNFKRFNDTYGHDEGDKIIQALARQIKDVFRKTDLVGRFGGDEFMVFVRNVPSELWLRDKLAHLKRLKLSGLICTMSAGVALFPQDAADFTPLFQRADRALYRAKEKKEHGAFFSETGKP